jgi:hypothetical protein
MKYLPVLCDLHGWLLLDAEIVKRREGHVIECEGHFIVKDTRNTELFETSEYIPNTRGLTNEEFQKLKGLPVS